MSTKKKSDCIPGADCCDDCGKPEPVKTIADHYIRLADAQLHVAKLRPYSEIAEENARLQELLTIEQKRVADRDADIAELTKVADAEIEALTARPALKRDGSSFSVNSAIVEAAEGLDLVSPFKTLMVYSHRLLSMFIDIEAKILADKKDGE